MPVVALSVALTRIYLLTNAKDPGNWLCPVVVTAQYCVTRELKRYLHLFIQPLLNQLALFLNLILITISLTRIFSTRKETTLQQQT